MKLENLKSESELERAIERMEAHVHWWRHGKLSDDCPGLAIKDME